MPIFAILTAIGIAAKVGGTLIAAGGARRSFRAQSAIEDERSLQMSLDATRQRREIIRQSLVARATSISNAVNQGAQYGTGLEGGLSQITGQTERNLTSNVENETIGRNIFALNKQVGKGQTQSYVGGALTSLGEGFIQSAAPISRAFGQPVP